LTPWRRKPMPQWMKPENFVFARQFLL